MSRCTGHCCRRFPLPVSPEDLQANPKRWEDGEYIAAMVVPLGETKERASEFGGGLFHYYTCKHLTPLGDCAEYEARPAMCRNYPYGNRCDHVGKGCTMEPLVSIGFG